MIRAINYNVEKMGNIMKSSKKKFRWIFQIDEGKHILELEFSFLSGKRKISLDGRCLYESTIVLQTAFQYPFNVDGCTLNIIQQGEQFELRINNKVFNNLYNSEKTRQEFKWDEDEVQKEDFNLENMIKKSNQEQTYKTMGQYKLNTINPNSQLTLQRKASLEVNHQINEDKFGKQVKSCIRDFSEFNYFDFQDFSSPQKKTQQVEQKPSFPEFNDFHKMFQKEAIELNKQEPRNAKTEINLLDLDDEDHQFPNVEPIQKQSSFEQKTPLPNRNHPSHKPMIRHTHTWEDPFTANMEEQHTIQAQRYHEFIGNNQQVPGNNQQAPGNNQQAPQQNQQVDIFKMYQNQSFNQGQNQSMFPNQNMWNFLIFQFIFIAEMVKYWFQGQQHQMQPMHQQNLQMQQGTQHRSLNPFDDFN